MSIAVEEPRRPERIHVAPEQRPDFVGLLADLSATFVNLPPDGVDGEIGRALRAIVEFFGSDRGTLAELSEEDEHLRVVRSYAAAGFDPCPNAVLGEGYRWYVQRARRGELTVLRRLPDHLPEEAVEERELAIHEGLKSHLSVPLSVGGSIVGVISLDWLTRCWDWSDEPISRLRLLGQILANALAHRRADLRLRQALEELEELRDRLQQENVYLRRQISLKHHHGQIVGESDAIREVLARAERVAATDTSVLIVGETGTGKELLARAIHDLSRRKDRAMVTVNCAALTATLIESELFGREAGAYTGALSKQAGRFEIADGATLFLDEIGELPLDLQAKLLRVLQDGEFERVGSPETIRVDVRIIAATNRDIEKAVREGSFREDLYHRLNIFPIRVPPLRERREDVPLLVWALVEELSKKMGRAIDTVSKKTMDELNDYPWPGNVRELSNVIERAMILSTGSRLEVDVPSASHAAPACDLTLEEVQRRHILQSLEKTGWRVSGKNGAAERLAVKPTTLEYRMAKLGIKRKR